MATIAKKCSICGKMYPAYNYVDIPVSREDEEDPIYEDDDGNLINYEADDSGELINYQPNAFEFITIKEDMDIQYDFDNNDLCPECMTIFENFVTGKIPSATGNPVVLEDAAPGTPIEMVVDIQPVQDGSGDPSPDNVRTISGFETIKITRSGKNVLSDSETMSSWGAGSATVIESGVATLTGNTSYTAVLSTKKYDAAKIYDGETTYIFSYEYRSNDDCLIKVVFNGSRLSADDPTYARTKYLTWKTETVPSSNGQWVKRSVNARTISIAQLTSGTGDVVSGYINIYNQTTDKPFEIRHCQMERSSVASDWSAYGATEYEVAFDSAGTVYGGTLNVTTGELVVDRVYETLNDPSKWAITSRWSGSGFVYQQSVSHPRKMYETSFFGLICSIAPVDNSKSFTARWNTADGGTKVGLHDRTSSLTLEQVQALATAGDISVVYELAEPLTYQLTPAQIRLLKGSNTIETDAGTLTIKYKKAIEGKMEVES